MKKEITFTKDQDIRILSDPYRIRILETFRAIGDPATVKQVADKLGDASSKVSFHVKKLMALGLLELDHTKVINGIIAKYFKLVYDVIHVQMDHPDKTLSPMTEMMMKQLRNDFHAAVVNDPGKSRFTRETIYLSKSEADEVVNLICEIAEKGPRETEGTEAYVFYGALIKKA